MHESTHSPRVFYAVMAAVALVLAIICMSGGTTQNAQVAFFAGLGVLLLVVPFQRRLPRGCVLAVGAFLLLAAVAFLPSSLFAVPAWRTKLIAAGVILPGGLSPQPLLSAKGMALAAAGFVWLLWLLALPWNSYLRRSAVRCLAYGIVLIAGFALVTWWMGIKIPGWLAEGREFGPFPNRNHTGHVLAIGGVLALGCAFDAMRWNRGKWGFWLFGAVVILVALVVNYSRGGLLLFFGSLGLWAAFSAWQQKSWKLIAIAFSAILLAAAAVLVKGGATAERFAGGENSEVAFRFKVWSDTLQMCSGSPWCGVGLENFTSIFPFYRKASVVEQTVLHPESDWLLVAAETGWVGVACLAILLVILLRRALPFASGTQRRLRLAAFSVAIGAALHGLVDVPGHRLGCVLLSLFALAIARHDVHSEPVGISIKWLSRGLGVGLVVLAVWWGRLPDYTTEAESFSANGDYAAAYQTANEGLKQEPLNWQLYFIRAKAEMVGGKILAAVADFRRARILEPHYPRMAYEEGMLWVGLAPGLAIEPWKDTLSRAGEEEGLRMFDGMLGSRPKDREFRMALLATAVKPYLQLHWFRSVPYDEAFEKIDELQVQSENWSPALKKAFKERSEEVKKKLNKQ